MNKKEIEELENLIIEDLVDSDFTRSDDAYVFILNRYSDLNFGRLGYFFLKQLQKVDWDRIEKEVFRIMKEIDIIVRRKK